MSGLRNAVLMLLFAILLAHLGGCMAATTPSHEPPGWVRVVVPERDGRSFFVGGTSFASDSETGIEAAEADARSQIHLKGTRYFTDLFNSAIRGSGVETTPMERMDLKNSIIEVYGDRMAERARQDSSFHRPCGSPGEASESGAPVCQVFVLMSVDAADWSRELGEVLAVEKRRRAEEGERNLAQFTEWITRQALEEQPEGARERSR